MLTTLVSYDDGLLASVKGAPFPSVERHRGPAPLPPASLPGLNLVTLDGGADLTVGTVSAQQF